MGDSERFGVREHVHTVQWYLIDLYNPDRFDRTAFGAWVVQFGREGSEDAEIKLRCVILGSVMGVFPKDGDVAIFHNKEEEIMRGESQYLFEEPGFWCFATWRKVCGQNEAGKTVSTFTVRMVEACDCHEVFDVKKVSELARQKMVLLKQMGVEVEI